jgi:DnaJ-class molecular chaperone
MPNITCPVCSGTGNDPNIVEDKCDECGNTGTIWVSDGTSY